MSLNWKKILLIDDSKFMLHTYQRILENNGATCFLAYDGEEALQKLSVMNPRPDLILCDVIMPQMSGVELRNKIRQDFRFQDIPFIFLSANEISGDSMHKEIYIKKPFTEESFIATIKNALKPR
jgi:two-component system response regulator VicR